MSSSNISVAAAATDTRESMLIFIQVWSIGLFAFGIFGHALSIYVFTRPKFRQNPCTLYFLASTLSGYVVVLFIVPLRLLQISYNIDVFLYSLPMCQILSYAFAWFRVLPSWFTVLASIDRFLCSSSSATLRGWSNVRVAYRSILLTVIFIGLVYIHVPINYTILLPQQSCNFVSANYQRFFALWNLFFWSWIPTACMLIFGLLIIGHIRQGKRRVAPQNQLQHNHKKTDRQLIQMLLVQLFVLSSTTMALSIVTLYISTTSNLWVKNDLDKAKDNYLSFAFNYIALSGPCMSFYMFTLSSQLFRHELINLFCCRQSFSTAKNTHTGNTR